MTDDETPAAGAPIPDPFEGPGWDRSSRRRTQASADIGPQDPDVRVRRERRQRSKYVQQRKRRRILIAGGVVALAVVAAVAWLLYTGLRARHELEAVRAEVRQLRAQITAGDLDQARVTARTLRSHADKAHDLTTGPLWAGAAAVPWLGDPLDSARAVTAGVAELAEGTLPDLVDASKTFDPQSLRKPDGSIDLATISDAAPALHSAAKSMEQVVQRIDDAPASTWLASVDSARGDLLDQLSGFQSTVDSADTAVAVVPTMLGADGTRSYLVGFQNEAELRGTGGLPGAFAILEADHGQFRFTRFESDNTLTRQPTDLDFGTDYDRLWTGADPTNDYRDSNISPNFPYAAQVWVAQWKALTGQQLDGAVTLDPTALSYLLKVTGAATLPDHTKVNSKNAVALTQNTVYLKYGTEQNKQRKKFLLTVARAVSARLIDSHANTTALVRAAAHAASERRLLVWSRDADIESRLAPTKIGGVVPDNAAPYAGVALNNASAGKLDYYLQSSVTIDRSGCGNTRDVTVTMTFRNAAPAKLTQYMYGRYGGPKEVPHAGDNLTLVSYYATAGGELESITLDGKPSSAGSGRELGHPVFSVRLYLPRGQQSTIVMHLREPAAPGELALRPQPMVHPMTMAVHTHACG
jgi:hypothetical protein